MLDVQHYQAALKKCGITAIRCTAAWQREVDGDLEGGYMVQDLDGTKYIRHSKDECSAQTLAARYDLIGRLRILDTETGEGMKPVWILDPFELQKESIEIEVASSAKEDITEFHTPEDEWDVDLQDDD